MLDRMGYNYTFGCPMGQRYNQVLEMWNLWKVPNLNHGKWFQMILIIN